MLADDSGNITGSQLTMGAMMGGGSLGQATFTGGIVLDDRIGASHSAIANPAVVTVGTITGTFVVTSGPFTEVAGSWTAAAIAPVAAVPTLRGSELGLLSLRLIGAALRILWRHRLATRVLERGRRVPRAPSLVALASFEGRPTWSRGAVRITGR
jgi:hypothetical protein